MKTKEQLFEQSKQSPYFDEVFKRLAFCNPSMIEEGENDQILVHDSLANAIIDHMIRIGKSRKPHITMNSLFKEGFRNIKPLVTTFHIPHHNPAHNRHGLDFLDRNFY